MPLLAIFQLYHGDIPLGITKCIQYVLINFTRLVKIISTASNLIVICYNTSLTFISNIKIENEILIQNILILHLSFSKMI